MTNKIAATLAQQKIADLQKSTDASYDTLINKQEKSKLPEDVFKAHFLPYFSGKEVQGDRNVYADWVGVAGTPMAEVDVISPRGEVLFTVPPLFDTNMIEIMQRKAGKSLSNIVHEFETRKAGIPAAADNFYNNALAQKVDEIAHRPADANSANARWNTIFQRYELIPEQKKTPDIDVSDDLDYD